MAKASKALTGRGLVYANFYCNLTLTHLIPVVALLHLLLVGTYRRLIKLTLMRLPE